MKVLLCTLFSLAGCTSGPVPSEHEAVSDTQLASLDDLAIETLRSRHYGSSPRVVRTLSTGQAGAAYAQHYSRDGSASYQSYVVSYRSDGLEVYSRLDVPPVAPPEGGFPIVVFLHGWVGADAAPDSNFSYAPDAYYGRSIDSYVDGGFAVFSPGYRGHGTVSGAPAQGIEFLESWDNGTYLSPLFYAVDVLNLIEGIEALTELPTGGRGSTPLALDVSRIFLAGHSQGGDVALTVLAVSGEGSSVRTRIAGASIWSGTFAPRLDQLATYYPMQTTAAAFVSGDGTWNGTALGSDHSVNPDFVFGYPAPWIETPSPQDWTWQNQSWPLTTVEEAISIKTREMYDAINAGVTDMASARFQITRNSQGRVIVNHDLRVVRALARIDAFSQPQFLTETVLLHFSDRDYYSLPTWNERLCQRINEAGGNCAAFMYAQNTHLLGVSNHRWFSDATAVPGFAQAMARDIALFEQTPSHR